MNLPRETDVNIQIPQSVVFLRVIRRPSYQVLYNEQVNALWWRNKLTTDTYHIERTGVFTELEVFETKVGFKSLDKRLLREIDRAIPYYILHVLSYKDSYQMFLADKRMRGGNVRVENYTRSGWLQSDELKLDFKGKTLDSLYENLRLQIRNEKAATPIQKEESSEFMRYFQKMAMTRAYKPILIMAALRNGGQITVQDACSFFKRYYAQRIRNGLPIEKGKCVYSDVNASDKEIEGNLVRNPVAALCASGFFQYDAGARIFSLKSEIYDGLTVDDIDSIIRICQTRLNDYFERS